MSNSKMEKYFFRVSAEDFYKIPGKTISYWASKKIINIFSNNVPLHTYATPRAGMITGNNAKFVRFFHEVEISKFSSDIKSREEAKRSFKKWFPYQKGGPFRKYYGNMDTVVDWEKDGFLLKNTFNSKGKVPAHAFNENYIFKSNVNWSSVTSGMFSTRITEYGNLFDASGSAAFSDNIKLIYLLSSYLNSPIARQMISYINPTLNFQAWEIGSLPFNPDGENFDKIFSNTKELRGSAKSDWDSYETSWDFTTLPLLQPNYRQATLAATYQSLRAHWQENTLEMQRLEEENNRIFIEAYGLEDELTPEVPLEEITLTCNPHYRYRLGKAWDDKTEEERTTELETRLQQDTMQEFISYAVGCMFGRYSLDKEGLVLANQGETLEDYLAQVPNPSFMPDDDNVIPMLDGDWFTDDVVERFKEFLKTTFGEEHYETNLAFIEKALNVKGTRNYSIRDYFLKEFYNDHVRTYKKRPIYWLFSSPKGSFNALVYMHRYRPDTVSVVLNGYLREYQTKLKSHKQNLEAISIDGGSQTEKTRALKEIERINKVLHELEEYERDVVYPLATEQVGIDLDDGVKQNYPKLGKALKKITGL